jgi:hypothetical protein
MGVAPARITSVRVTGAVSGAPPGLRRYSGARGASFALDRPLSQGERVGLRVRIRGALAPVAFSFTVARLGAIQPVLNLPIRQPAKLDHFVSAPSLLAPRITVAKGSSSAAGDIFLAPLPSPEIHPQSNNALTIHPSAPAAR